MAGGATEPWQVEPVLIGSVPGSPMEGTLNSMRDQGVKFIYGRWLIEGAPLVLLFDTASCYNR